MFYRAATAPSDYVTVALLSYRGFRARNWAFWQMAPAPIRLMKVAGVTFSRLMGCGAGNGFSLKPDLGTYVWLAGWKDCGAADTFFADHPWWRSAGRRCRERMILRLRPTLAFGGWHGPNPFRPSPAAYDPAEPVVVVTRATVATAKMVDFRRHVPAVSQLVSENDACPLSLGIGEYPLFLQATLSLWRSGTAMQQFAYGCPLHREIVGKTRRRGWYREELFARFRIEGIDGSWKGRPAGELIS